MSALAAYGRLVWRPRTTLNVFAALSMGVAAAMLTAWLHRLSGEAEPEFLLRRGRLLLIALPAGAGIAAGFPVQELLHASFAWNLPRVRERLCAALALVGALASAATVLGLARVGWLAAPPVPALALALMAYSMGLLVLDWMHPRRLFPRVSLGLLLLSLLFSEALWSAMSSWPVAATLLFASGAAWLLPQCVSREALRHKGLQRIQRSIALAPTVSASLADLPELEARIPARPPAMAPRGDRPWMWVRAAHYEAFGWSRRGWVYRLGALLVVPPILIGVFHLVDLYLSTGSARDALELLHAALLDPRGTSPNSGIEFMAPFGALLALLFLGQVVAEVLRPELLQPISRRERAEITWRLHLVIDLGVVGVLALGLLLATALLALLFGFEGGVGSMPAWLRGLLVVMILAPIGRRLQYTRLGRGPALRPAHLAGWILMIILAQGLSKLWTHQAQLLPAAAWAALVLALLAASQLLLRAHLRRWLARCDLVGVFQGRA